MAENATTQDVRIEDVGPCLKRLTITIPASVVDEQLDSSLQMVAVEAELPGFRKGRAPRRLIEKKFGTVVAGEARNQLLASAYSKAIEENELQVIGDPDDAAIRDIELKPGEDVTLELEVEVAPQFELPDFEGYEVKKPAIEVTEERVDGQIERILLNEGELEPREVAEPGDYCIGRGVMTPEGGEVALDLENAVIQLPTADGDGSGMILGVIVPDFREQAGLP